MLLKEIAHRARHTRYFLSKEEVKDYNVMIDGQNFFNQPVKNDLRTYDIEEDDYTTGCSLDCPYFKENYN